MWMKWFPWRFVVRSVAKEKGFLDPIALMAHLQRFAQPSEVAAPTELLRSGAALHARGLMNSQAIQHNMDWLWPFWVERQFNPLDDAFVPRAFSITHINLTHRNWTAVGMPDTLEWPIVDPRGLVTPFFDGWSIDIWVVGNDGVSLFPSRAADALQSMTTEGNLKVITELQKKNVSLASEVEVVGKEDVPVCQITITALSDKDARLVIALRPYNPEGVSFIHDVAWHENLKGWTVNNNQHIYFNDFPQQFAFSNYHKGDVYSHLPSVGEKTIESKNTYESVQEKDITCSVGMATAAAIFKLEADVRRRITIHIPLIKKHQLRESDLTCYVAENKWKKSLEQKCSLQIPDEYFQFLYDAAVRTLVLHSPEDVYPGPYTYKRFWFRDAVFILNAMLVVGLTDRAERMLDRFPSRQTPLGYFLSQEGEWDSNGEALWAFQKFCELTGRAPNANWCNSAYSAGEWIMRKRLSKEPRSPHAGLLPAGFSAEHLGPNDYYYWDDFWGVAGLKAAAFLLKAYKNEERAERFFKGATDFHQCVERSLAQVKMRLKNEAIPASPYRRMDSGAIGSLVASYPLQIVSPKDKRVLKSVEFLMNNCLVHGGFFQDMTHSGINPYLTLHIAQVLLRAEDIRYFDLMKVVASLASSTGQWPEAIHPKTKGGCMGDGQHVWAAAEWIMMIRNCFVREENDCSELILCSGVPKEWLQKDKPLVFGSTQTSFGPIKVFVESGDKGVEVRWEAKWFSKEPTIVVQFPGKEKVVVEKGKSIVEVT